MAWIFTIVCLLALGATLYAEVQRPSRRRIPKMVAASAFLLVALSAGGLDSTFGRIVVAGLALSWCGDLLLTYNGRGPFVSGLVAFLAAHIAYVVAFAYRGLDADLWAPLAVMAAIAIPVARWLLPTVPRELKIPVMVYMAAISVMVATAVSTHAAGSDWRIPIGAGAFYLSDLGVARDRFAWPGLVNRMVGLPLYFGGQLLLAWAAGG